MPTWSARADIWFADPQDPTSTATIIASQRFKVEFDCALSEKKRKSHLLEDRPDGAHGEGEGAHVLVKSALDLPSCDIIQAQGWTRLDLQLPDARFGLLELDVALHSAYCAEGKGLIVWVRATGQFDTNANPPPHEWREWAVKGAWQICCCCDPFGDSHSWTAVARRQPTGFSQPPLTIRLFADEKSGCEEDARPRRYNL